MNEQNLHLFPALFCKPPIRQAQGDNAKSLFSKFYPEIKATLSFRPLNLKEDLALIHEWVQQHYALKYWQMNGPYSQLYAIYQCMELNPYSASFVGLLNGQVVCQYDVYSVFADELKQHVDVKPNDCGFHLLMSPNKQPVKGLTSIIVNAFLEYYFSFPQAKRMYAEPDVYNVKSIDLLERCGFHKVKTVEMSYKTAHVYVKERAY